jgi:hypothetical protein
MAIAWECSPHTTKSDYYGGPDSPGFTIWPDGAIVSGLTVGSGRLINAAADMLAALRIGLEWAENDGYPDDHCMVSDGERAFRIAARAAIAKAEEPDGKDRRMD